MHNHPHNLAKLNDNELWKNTLNAVKTERKSTAFVIRHLLHIEKRRLYLDRQFPSLVSYLSDHLGFSYDEAYKRADATKLIIKMPENDQLDILCKLELGKLSLTAITKLSSSIKQHNSQIELEKTRSKQSDLACKSKNPKLPIAPDKNPELPITSDKNTQRLRFEADPDKISKKIPKKISVTQTLDFLKQAEGRSVSDSQKIFASKLKTPEIQKPVTRQVSNSETRVHLSFSREQMEVINKFKEVFASKNPKGDLSNAFVLAMQKCLDEHDKEIKKYAAKFKSKQSALEQPSLNLEDKKEQSPHAINPINHVLPKLIPKDQRGSRHISKQIKAFVFERDSGQCTFKDPITGHRCQSKYNLHYDHKIPHALSGDNSPQNIRLLCSAHNLHQGRKLLSGVLLQSGSNNKNMGHSN